MSNFIVYPDGAVNLDEVVRAVCDSSGGITFYLSDGSNVLIGTAASTKAEALTVLTRMTLAVDIEIYDD